MIEVPVTVRKDYRMVIKNYKGIKQLWRQYKIACQGYGVLWLRPNGKNLDDLLYLLHVISKDKYAKYIMFMLHSSELMPGGSPTFDNEEKIEKLYCDLEILFKEASRYFIGETIGGFAMRIG